MASRRSLLAAALLLGGCHVARAQEPAPHPRVDAALLSAFRRRLIEQEPRIRALAVVRDDQVVFEYHRQDLEPEGLHPMQSVTKSVLSTLVGIAIAQGRLLGVDEWVADVLEPARQHPAWAGVRLSHLLTQRSGLERLSDGGGDYSRMRTLLGSDPDWLATALARRRAAPPGARFAYSNLDTQLIAAILEARTGIEIQRYAREHLLLPLGIHDGLWHRVGGHADAAAGLSLRLQDMLRLGRLWLQRGRWQGRELLGARYLDEAMTDHVGAAGPGQGVGYGYLFWTGEGRRAGWRSVYAAGYGGQMIVVVPTHATVVAVASEFSDLGSAQGSASTARALREGLMPAIRD